MDIQSLYTDLVAESKLSQDERRNMAICCYLVAVLPRLREEANNPLPEGFEPPANSPLRDRSTKEKPVGDLHRMNDFLKCRTQLDYILQEANALSEINPLQYSNPVKKKKKSKKATSEEGAEQTEEFTVEGGYLVPSWRKEPCSGLYVTALLLGGLWVKCLESEDMAGVLLDSWPSLKAAILISPPSKPKEETQTPSEIASESPSPEEAKELVSE